VGTTKDYALPDSQFCSHQFLNNDQRSGANDDLQITIEDQFRALETIYNLFPSYVPEPITLVADEEGDPIGYRREQIEGYRLKDMLREFDVASHQPLAQKLAADIGQMLERLHRNQVDHGNLGLEQIIVPVDYEVGTEARYRQNFLDHEPSRPTLTEPLNLAGKGKHKEGMKRDIRSFEFIKELLEVK